MGGDTPHFFHGLGMNQGSQLDWDNVLLEYGGLPYFLPHVHCCTVHLDIFVCMKQVEA